MIGRKKRFHSPVAKAGELKVQYGRVDGNLDLAYAWGGAGAEKPDGRILMRALEDNEVFDGKSLRQELEARGYDITTLKFSIQRIPPARERKTLMTEAGKLCLGCPPEGYPTDKMRCASCPRNTVIICGEGKRG